MDTTAAEPEKISRPQFLQVLCILTFIGVGIMLALSAWGIKKTFLLTDQEKQTAIEQTVAQVLQTNPDADEDHVSYVLTESAKYEKMNWYVGVAGNILTLLGALMMWQMKKIGFWLYVAGELLPYVLPLAICGTASYTAAMDAGAVWGGMAAKIGSMVFAFVIIFDIAFLIMYSLNLKHLKS